MIYEWDAAKNEVSIRERGLDFADAHRVFDGDAFVDQEDTRRAYGELRINVIGRIGPKIVHLTYTDRPNGKRRIISMRDANRKERRQWHERFPTP